MKTSAENAAPPKSRPPATSSGISTAELHSALGDLYQPPSLSGLDLLD